MAEQPLRADIQDALQQMQALVKQTAIECSSAGLLAENEPFGDMVMYSLIDDSPSTSNLGAQVRIIGNWLIETEKRYKSQFAEPTGSDSTATPIAVKTRFELFKEIVESSETETCNLWTTELTFDDPLRVTKRFRNQLPPE